MFKLDPHIDPLNDGGKIFILGLKSDTVLTITPSIETIENDMKLGKKLKFQFPLRMRTDEAAIALRSWTDEDIDILVKERSIAYLYDDARYKWKHAIRIGVDVGPPIDGICDWWGNLDSLIKRNDVRISVVLAFE